jgi:hypothetical protein
MIRYQRHFSKPVCQAPFFRGSDEFRLVGPCVFVQASRLYYGSAAKAV